MRLISSIITLLLVQTSVAEYSYSQAFDIFWISCGIKKYCAEKDRQLIDNVYIDSEREAVEVLLKVNKNNRKSMTCDDADVKQQITSHESLVILKVSAVSSQELENETCLSKVKALEGIQVY